MLISKNHLRARHTVSKDDSRPMLTVIDIIKDGDEVVAVSTDGYVLTEVRESTPNHDEFPEVAASGAPIDHVRLFAKTATKMKPAMKGDKMLPILGYGKVTENGVVTTDLARTTIFEDRQIEGNFPDYGELIPSTDGAVAVVNLNPQYLAKVLKAFDGLSSVTLELHGQMKPVVVRSTGGEATITGMVMPQKA